MLTFGQFTEGLSKEYVRRNQRTGFLVMSLQKEVWRGMATFTHSAKGGPEHEAYNNVEQTGRQALPMGGIVAASLAAARAGPHLPARRAGAGEGVPGGTRATDVLDRCLQV